MRRNVYRPSQAPLSRESASAGAATKQDSGIRVPSSGNGQIRRRIVADVTGRTLKGAIREEVDRQARIVTDELSSYTRNRARNLRVVTKLCIHGTKEYVAWRRSHEHGGKQPCASEARHHGHLSQRQPRISASLSVAVRFSVEQSLRSMTASDWLLAFGEPKESV